MKIIFKSNIMYTSSLGAVKYSQTALWAESKFRLILIGVTSRIVRHFD